MSGSRFGAGCRARFRKRALQVQGPSRLGVNVRRALTGELAALADRSEDRPLQGEMNTLATLAEGGAKAHPYNRKAALKGRPLHNRRYGWRVSRTFLTAAEMGSPRVVSIQRTPLGSSFTPLRERTTLTRAAGSMGVSGWKRMATRAPWRSMLAAALEQVTCTVEAVEVEGEEFNPSCELLAMWLADRLDVPVKRSLSSGPGLTAVRMHTDSGPITLDRPDGSLATLSIQGQPNRAVALKRRETAELIAEELRRLDPDDTYASALRFGVDRLNEGPSFQEPAPKGEPVAAGGQVTAGDVAGGSADEPVAVETPVEEAAKAPAAQAAAPEPVKQQSKKAAAK